MSPIRSLSGQVFNRIEKPMHHIILVLSGAGKGKQESERKQA